MMTIENFLHSWRTTAVGIAHAVNHLVMLVEALNSYREGVPIDPLRWVIYLTVGAALNLLGMMLAKDAGKGSDRDQPVADEKLDNVEPTDTFIGDRPGDPPL